MSGKQIRMQRLFPDGGKPVIVAMDHGQTFGPIDGLVDFTAAAECLKEADGVLMAPQMIRFSGNLYRGKGSPVCIARLNWNSIHAEPWQYRQAYIVKGMPAEAAVAAGADVLLAGLVLLTGDEEHDAQNVQLFSALAEDCRRLGMPLIGEVFPVGGLRKRPDEFHDYIKKACRIACELGADAIKTFYTGERFAEVTEGMPIPVFALGAEKLERQVDALALAERAVKGGAQGVVFGRNVIQAPSPADFLAGLKAVVQGQASPPDAAERYGLK